MLNDGEGKKPTHVTLAEAVAALTAHFDSVQIFVSRHDKKLNRTEHLTGGFGNWYARYGQISEWVNIQDQDAYERHAASRRGPREDEDDDEDDDDSGEDQSFESN